MKYSGLKVGGLESSHGLKVILALYREGTTARSALYAMISSANRTVADRIKELVDLELVEEVQIDKPPYRALQLTKKGKDVAEHIEAVERILNR